MATDEGRGESRRLASMISVRVAPVEEEALREEAARRGETVSTFMRLAALSRAGINGSGAVTVGNPTTTTSTVLLGGVTYESAPDGTLRPRSAAGQAVVNLSF